MDDSSPEESGRNQSVPSESGSRQSTPSEKPTSQKENTGSKTDSDLPEYNPEDSKYVQDGELTVRPFVDVFGFEGMTTDSLELIMTAMPNPLGDYEINVHYTPLSNVEDEWKLHKVRSLVYGGATPRYNNTTNNWNVYAGDPTITTIREVQQKGVQIGTITVPSHSAGLIAHDVPNPFKTGDVDVEFNEDGEMSDLSEEQRKELSFFLEQYAPDWGDRYTDFVESVISETPVLQIQFRNQPGNWLSGTGPLTPPFVKSFEYDLTDEQVSSLGLERNRDEGFPEQEPFVLTFTVNDSNSRHNDPEKIVAQTPTAIPDPHNPTTLYTPNVKIQSDSTETWLQKDWTEGIIDGNNWERVGIDEVYQDVDYDSSDDTTAVKISRVTNYGRYSPKMEEFAQKKIDATPYSSSGVPEYLASDGPAYLDSPMQSAWCVDYEVQRETVKKAQREADRAKKSNIQRHRKYEDIVDSAVEYDVIKDITSQLRNVCNNIGTETPTEEIRVVADFVSYLSHIALDEDPPGGSLYGMGTPGPQHPVWTLYHQTGDCEDFTVLANSILSMDEFGYEPGAGVVDLVSFSRDDTNILHISTGIRLDQLEIDDVKDDALLEFPEKGRTAIQGGLQYKYGTRKYAYIEMSAPYPIGTTYGRRGYNVDPEAYELWTI